MVVLVVILFWLVYDARDLHVPMHHNAGDAVFAGADGPAGGGQEGQPAGI